MKNSGVSLWFAAVLWVLGVYQVAMIGVRMYAGTIADTPLLGRQLQPGSGPEQFVAFALVGTFILVLGELLRLFIRLTSEKNAAAVFSAGGQTSLQKILAGTMARRRAELAANSRQNGEALSQILGAASSVDASALENTFTFARALTWSLPSLGFIGAALGLSQSIGGFSSSLKAGDSSALVASLAQQVIPGLAGSFSITIAALGAATVAHLCTTSLAAWGHRVIGDLDVQNLGTISRTVGSVPAPPVDVGRVVAVLDEVLREMTSLNSKFSSLGQLEALKASASELSAAGVQLKSAAAAIIDSTERPYIITVDRQKRVEQGRSR